LTLKGCPSRIISYLIDIYKNIENCLIIRDIFFGANSHRQNEYRSMTLENLTCRLNIAFKWMSERCDLPWTKKWKIKGDPNGLVFSTEKSINCHDIAEAHAVAHELMAIRAFGDKECFTQRLNKVLESSYKIGIEIGRKGLQKINGFEFSPLLLLHRGLLAFCTCIDLTVAEDYNGDLFIEDHLPWLQFEQIDIFSGSFHSVAAQALNLLNTKHIYQNGSNWGCLKKFNDIDNTDLQTIYNNMVWLGMDLQVHAFHRNSKTNRSYIVDYLSNKDFAYDQVNKKLIDNNYLIEYSNSLIYYCMDLPKVYGGQWSELMAIGFGQLNNSIMQLFCHLLNGAQKRNTIARFLREQVPNPDIIANKLNNSIHKQCSEMEIKEDEANQIANRASKILKRLIENGKFGESGEAGFLVNNHGRFII
ncbi:MAG: hypothetical protein OEZ38_13905, partial [Gammaproteobacteria bacterium]|nr:hypothetical protein [Gammaproteobacteria bacterium]